MGVEPINVENVVAPKYVSMRVGKVTVRIASDPRFVFISVTKVCVRSVDTLKYVHIIARKDAAKIVRAHEYARMDVVEINVLTVLASLLCTRNHHKMHCTD